MLSFLFLRLLVPYQDSALDLLGGLRRSADPHLVSSCLRRDKRPSTKLLQNYKRPFTNLIWKTKTVVWQSAWKNPWYVTNRFISEEGRLISDVLEMTNILNKEGYLWTIDIEKAFHSVDHYFLLAILEKYGFKKNFLRWTKTLLNNQECCIINGGITTHCFKLKRGTRQGDPFSLYLFILVLETVFCVIKSNKNIEGLNIFNHEFLYTVYADDITFFLKP